MIQEDNVLVYTENMTTDKLDTLYIGLYKIIDIKETTVHLSLLGTKIYLKFHVSLIKKVLPEIPLYET